MRQANEVFRIKAPNGTRLLVSREIAGQGRPFTRVWVMGEQRDPTPNESKYARAAIRLQQPTWKRKNLDTP